MDGWKFLASSRVQLNGRIARTLADHDDRVFYFHRSLPLEMLAADAFAAGVEFAESKAAMMAANAGANDDGTDIATGGDWPEVIER
jgi:hypothetical protein